MNRTLLILIIIVIVAALLVCGCLVCGVLGLTLSLMSAGPSPTSQDLVGSRWHMTYVSPSTGKPAEYYLTFQAAGKLKLSGPPGVTIITTGAYTWELDGTQITLRFNDGYATYEGQLSGGDFMSGTAENVKSFTWEWEARRIAN
jgi:hypothetical protein